MKSLIQRHISALIGVLLAVSLMVGTTPARGRGIPARQNGDTKRNDEASRRASDAAKVFDEVMGAPDKGIPQDLLNKAEAIAVFPGVLKAGFIVGGREGKGVVSRRVAGSWSAPAFFNLKEAASARRLALRR